jgi:hypothetical protein
MSLSSVIGAMCCRRHARSPPRGHVVVGAIHQQASPNHDALEWLVRGFCRWWNGPGWETH